MGWRLGDEDRRVYNSRPADHDMSDPLRTDPAHASEPTSDAEREAKIEELLLAGLEHYFAARYDHAINVWTRALFLDRSHARARAYIERARSAQAERQRESEELLQTGVAAFHRGETDEARRLLQSAIDQGAHADEALGVLDRLNRLVPNGSASVSADVARTRPRARTRPVTPLDSSRIAWVALAALAMVIVGAAAFAAGAFRSEWRGRTERTPTAGTARSSIEEGLPAPRRGETALTRARALVAGGRLRDALATLDLVRATDAQKTEADRMRAEIQRQLIAVAAVPPTPAAAEAGASPQP